jgi:hypothetical protein
MHIHIRTCTIIYIYIHIYSLIILIVMSELARRIALTGGDPNTDISTYTLHPGTNLSSCICHSYVYVYICLFGWSI